MGVRVLFEWACSLRASATGRPVFQNRDTYGYNYRMARLKAGVEPTPHKVRDAAARAALKQAGGLRTTVDLDGEANAALRTICERDQCTKNAAFKTALLAEAAKR